MRKTNGKLLWYEVDEVIAEKMTESSNDLDSTVMSYIRAETGIKDTQKAREAIKPHKKRESTVSNWHRGIKKKKGNKI